MGTTTKSSRQMACLSLDLSCALLDPAEVISADALRMRLRRFCALKKGDKCIVDEQTRADYLGGGEKREWLEIALLEAIKKHGTGREVYKQVKAGFLRVSYTRYLISCPYI